MYDFTYSKYNYFTDEKNKVIAVATYAGKPVRGVAKCDPQDSFDLDTGKELAAARCNMKVAKKRQANALSQMKAAEKAYENAKKHYDNMIQYYDDACKALQKANSDIAVITNHLQ